jgi:hypothetical protein
VEAATAITDDASLPARAAAAASLAPLSDGVAAVLAAAVDGCEAAGCRSLGCGSGCGSV